MNLKDRRKPTLIIDTRERRPLVFPNRITKHRALKIGDYSLWGYQKLISVEYKSLPDYYSWIWSDRRRFFRQVSGLITIPYKCVVVGGKFAGKIPYSRIHPLTICEKTAYLMSIGIPVIFTNGRVNAAMLVESFLDASLAIHKSK